MLGKFHSTFTVSNVCFHFTFAEALQLLRCLTTAELSLLPYQLWKEKKNDTRLENVHENPHHDRIFLNHELHEHIKILYPYLLSTHRSYWMILKKTKVLKLKRGSIILNSVGNLLSERLQTCHNTNYIINE
jgi:hypothetical protein